VVALGFLAGDHQSFVSITGTLLLMIVGGALTGVVVASGFMLLAGRTPDYLVEITFTTLAAYGSFFVAEYFHWSGVLAALTAGLVVGNFRSSALMTGTGRHALGSFWEYAEFIANSLIFQLIGPQQEQHYSRSSAPMTDTGRQVLEPFWEYVAFIANSLIFLLIGAQEAQQHFNGVLLPVATAVVLVVLGRAVAIYPVCAVFSRSRLKVDNRQQHVLFWGGLRGALALALALALPDDLPRHDLIITLTFAVVAFSVFAQGLTITPLLRSLGLDRRP
jgi:CPA1 family monovalent cation:H+ antiporter